MTFVDPNNFDVSYNHSCALVELKSASYAKADLIDKKRDEIAILKRDLTLLRDTLFILKNLKAKDSKIYRIKYFTDLFEKRAQDLSLSIYSRAVQL